MHRLVSKGSRSNLLVRGPSKANLLARPSFSGTTRRSLDDVPPSVGNTLQTSSIGNNLPSMQSSNLQSSNLQSMQDLQSLGGQQPMASPQQLNWYRGDSIRGVDREFIYKVRTNPRCITTCAAQQAP